MGQAPDGSAVRVRLLGIDAPEVAHGSGGVAHCGGEAATTTLRQWVEGQDVILTVDPVADHRDRFDRVLAYVAPAWDTQLDVAFQLVEQGLAVAWFPRGEPVPTRFGSYQVAEVQARGLRTGRWADCADLGR